MNSTTKVSSPPSTIDPLLGRRSNPLQTLEAHTHNLTGGSQDDHKRSRTTKRSRQHQEYNNGELGFPTGNPSHEIPKWMGEKWRSLRWRCRSGPSPPILQRSMNLGGGIGRSWWFELSRMVGERKSESSLFLSEWGGIYTPSQNLAVGCLGHPEIPV